MDIHGRLPGSIPAGRWWRFDCYELRGGYLRPAAGAHLEEYDPWEAHRAARDGRTEGQPPYASLLALLDDLKVAPTGYGVSGQPYALTPAGEAKLLAWCRQHGLLGLLPHQAHQVHLAPRWGWSPIPGLSLDDLVPLRRWYVRGPFGWTYREEAFWQTHTPALEQVPKQEGALVPAELLPEYWPEPSVLLQELGDTGWRSEPLGGTWARFFPDVPPAERELHSYPQPGSAAFWHLYAEPLDAFLRGAAVLRDAVATLSQPSTAAEVAAQGEQQYLWQLAKGLEALHTLLTAVTPALLPLGDGTNLQQWLSRSLLGTFAMMAYLDLTERRRVFTCARCGKIFTSAAYQARYCSERCRYAAQKRAYRQRLRERAAGRPAQQGGPA